MKIRLSFVICLFPFFIFLMSCQRSTEPLPANNRPPIKKVHLTAEDASCTEAWLKLTTENPENDSLNYQLTLYRNEQAIDTMLFSGKDTLLYDRDLQPSKSYMYFARIYADNQLAAISDTVTVTTLDTTSHDFEWQSWEFGGVHGSSYFNDVAIIDENDIWAVGEIHTAETDQYDSSGNWVQPYNAAHWDGEKWELERVPYVDEKGNVWITPIYSIFAFSANDIWFEGGIHWNGSKFISLKMNINFPSHVNKIWGTSSSDLYIVGNDGLIAHYDGKEWTRIASGMNLKIQDIYGAGNDKNGTPIVCAIASNPFTADGNAVIEIKKTGAFFQPNGGLPYSLTGIWSPNGKRWYLSGDGIYRNYGFSKNWQAIKDVPAIYSEAIRGTAYNNIFVVGHFGLLLHWNGYSWKDFTDKNVVYYGLAVKGNTIVAVGTVPEGIVAGPAAILIGKRK